MIDYGTNTAEQIMLAEQWFAQYENYLRMLARDEAELQEYQQRPDANMKAVEVRKEKIQRGKNFAETTRTLIELQAELLKENNNAYKALVALRDKYQILEAFAQSKGIDLTLLPYLTKRDFNL